MTSNHLEGGNSHQVRDALVRERAARLICAELNNFVDLEQTLLTVIRSLKELTGCEAVGIRLHDDGDYPYYVENGFPEPFIQQESSLCARDDQGRRIPSTCGEGFLLECMCGNIIRGRFDPTLPFFTAGGSFWSNHTTALLASTTEEDRQSRTRNFCNSCGYESVALMPILARGERIGLIQLNDMRTGMFTERLIEFVEMIGGQVGLAVQNSLVHSRLKEINQDLSRSNEDLEQFAFVASHDLRGPLQQIISFARLLKEDYEDRLDEEGREFLDFINDGASWLQRMVRDLLAYSRVSLRSREYSTVSGEEILERALANLQLEIEDSGARVTREPLPDMEGDGVQLTLLFQNLIGNAIKFRDEQAPRIHVGVERRGDEWCFSVRDNGIGIRPGDAKLVFKLFQRLHAREQYGGTGLGLAISQKVVERHGGRIWVESGEGRGSIFSFTLPSA